MNIAENARQETCDKCGYKFTFQTGHFVCLPRPSDPTTWTCVLFGHPGCFPLGENCRTITEWMNLAESDCPPFAFLELV